ncbi:cationic amino acid transporter 2 [Anabrus simplex]|uniref:cationic amino acid transporter 2 n=1 Tax=Anabrus simplex TaxID=316456 RepID=UPI0034DCEDB5
MFARWVGLLSRKKTINGNVEKSELSRCLSVIDLTYLGVGSTLGLGVYVLAGAVARHEAGPAVTLSFLVAAIASAFAGVSYAEFAARVPRAGSAYVYSYVCVGEFVAFIIGWNLILEYIIGTASVARGLSNYIDNLIGCKMERFMTEIMPINIGFLSPYPDFLAFGIVMLLSALLSVGVRESTYLNNAFTTINIVTVLIVIIAGSLKADVSNWQLSKEDIPSDIENAGEGGFLPFGFTGVMAGAAKCFYGFVGFDCVATTGEEAKNPQRSIPLAIVASLIIIFLSYFGISTVLTMMWPYYLQDDKAPLPYVFTMVGWPVIMWIVRVGAIFALCTSMLGAMFPLPRVLYAMSTDGLLFRFLARVNPRTHTPVTATLISGFFAGIMATIFDLNQLIDMMSIGTLLAYTIVAVCVLILRYEDNTSLPQAVLQDRKEVDPVRLLIRYIKQLFNLSMMKTPSTTSALIAKCGITVFSILSILFSAIFIFGTNLVVSGVVWMVVLAVILCVFLLVTLLAIARQPHSNMKLSFKVPLVPFIPALSVLINIYLMMMLDYNTWIRFSVWMLLGLVIYFMYGIQNSEEKKRKIDLMSTKEAESSDTHF